VLEVRVLSPVDLAVSKLARCGDADREDIGDVDAVRTSIDLASQLVAAAQRRGRRR
jgi:hypothetical protein